MLSFLLLKSKKSSLEELERAIDLIIEDREGKHRIIFQDSWI